MAIDQKAFAEVFENGFAGDWDIFEATVSAFLESLDANLAALKAAFEARDLDGTMRWAHRIKGETSMFHTKEASQVYKVIETDARAGNFPSADRVNEGEVLAKALALELKTILEQKKGA